MNSLLFSIVPRAYVRFPLQLKVNVQYSASEIDLCLERFLALV